MRYIIYGKNLEVTEGLAGVRGKYGSKIEIRYNGPDLCV